MAPPRALVWDANSKHYQAQAVETNATVAFFVTNTTTTKVVIHSVHTSCGCTTVKMPAQPWVLPSGGNGQFQLTVDLRGKRGTLNKTITVDSTAGIDRLLLRVQITEVTAPVQSKRASYREAAQADRQAVFKGSCIPCHVTPLRGKRGAELYVVACGICHQANPRATMVPALQDKRDKAHRAYWRVWTAKGKAGTLMPGFAEAEGGPLSETQIDSLVEYLTQNEAAVVTEF